MNNKDIYIVFHKDGTHYQSHQVDESSLIEGSYAFHIHAQYWFKLHIQTSGISRWENVPKEEVPSIYRTQALLLKP